MSFSFLFYFWLCLPVLSGPLAQACEIFASSESLAPAQGDALYRLLLRTKDCPTSVQSLKSALQSERFSVKPAMVANRGFHNPELGSFSFFESAFSEGFAEAPAVYFGHFTTKSERKTLELDQRPSPRKLLVELIAWDPVKGYYNFYELIGTQTSARWFYRGDTKDILDDNQYIHLTPPSGEPKFGSRLRCSGCHVSGGPIMKELTFPHNDWWTKTRPLPLGSATPSGEVSSWMADLMDASEFSVQVRAGIDRLEKSVQYQQLKAQQPLNAQLRPLYCDLEINLESDSGQGEQIHIPSSFSLNPLLGQADERIMDREYRTLLRNFDLHFPETNRSDADHAWLTPVKGYSDLLAIRSLIERNIVTKNEALSVLRIDAENPLFSDERCRRLKGGSMVSARTETQFEKLLRLRKAVFESEISKNPRGQILEPGFRVIFPE